MCLAIPAQVVELQEQGMARVRVGESQTYLTASMLLLPEPPKVGDYVIVHAGFALHSLTPEQAQESLAALREVAEAIEGQKPLFCSATTATGCPAGKPFSSSGKEGCSAVDTPYGLRPARRPPPFPAGRPCRLRGLWPTRKSPLPHAPVSARAGGRFFRRKSAS